MSMENFFKPSAGLAMRMGDYHGPNSSVRLDLTPTHKPKWGSKISVKHVQESVHIHMWRFLGTLGRRVEYASIAVETSIVVNTKFSTEFAEGLYERFSIEHDSVGESLMEDLGKEFVQWLRSLGGKYVGHPKVEEILLVNDDSVELKF